MKRRFLCGDAPCDPYSRYAGVRGFTSDEFRWTAEEVAGTDLKEWFRKYVSSTDELDYTEALDWFGLRFVVPDDATGRWSVEVREAASPAQQEHLGAWLTATRATARRDALPSE